MSYRFVRITNYYPQYLENFSRSHKVTEELSFEEGYRKLINDSLELASAYTRALSKLPGVTAMDIVSNAEFLQNAWKRERGISNDLPSNEVIILQLKQFQPDVVWIDDFSLVTEQWMEALKKEVPSIRLVLGHICAPYGKDIENKFVHFDLVFSCIPCMVEELKAKGFHSALLYHSFDEEILERIKQGNDQFPSSKLLFSGSLYAGSGFHTTRLIFLEAFLKKGFPLSLYANLESESMIRKKKLFHNVLVILKKLRLSFLINSISFLRNKKAYAESPVKGYSRNLLQSTHSPVFGLSLFKLMSKADIVFNNHGEIAGKCAGNIRMFEVTGVGSCLLTDWKENISDLFEPGKEIVTYTDMNDCMEKIQWLLDHPEERKKIAKAGQERTLKDHTVARRVEVLNELILKELKNK